MKKKKFTLFTPIILLSFVFITLVSLVSFIQKKLSRPFFPSGSSNPSLPPVFSLLNLTSRPNSHFPSSPQISFVAVGDIMLGRYVNVKMLQNKDWRYPFLKTSPLLSSANLTFGNLEAPFVENCPTTSTGMVFCARPEAIEGLKFAGFDVLSLANNHILNQGQEGKTETINLLDTNNILPSENNLVIKKLSNLTFGFLSFDLVTYPKISPISQIFLISPTVDVLIVSLHWGNEYQKTPTQQQKDLAHQIIDAGAKVIIGHHSHVTQPTEKYHDGLIFYSLGNFVFDQPWSEETKKGNIAKIIFEGKNIKSYELIPVYIQDYCQPKISL